MKSWNSDVPSFQLNINDLFHLKQKCFPGFVCQNRKHLQDALLTKLLDQFIELHNTHFLKD